MWIMISKNLQAKKGFTLTELMVSLIVIAALSGLAIPRFNMHLERARSAEAVQILESLLKAQRAFFYENAAYTNVLADLEVNIPASTTFNAPVVATADPIASVARNNGTYTIRINANGIFSCAGGAICGNLGF
jgi:prepilin-type N-terminal cleavage/methylation domain-containing protein